jgi:hypothetical protein
MSDDEIAMEQRDDYAEPDLPPSPLPTLRDLVTLWPLSILLVLLVLAAWRLYS